MFVPVSPSGTGYTLRSLILATCALTAAWAAATIGATLTAIEKDLPSLLSSGFRQTDLRALLHSRPTSAIWYNHRPTSGDGLDVALSGVPKFDRYPSTGEVSWLKFVTRAERGPISATRAATRLGRRAAAETRTSRRSASRKAHPPAASGSAPPASKPSRSRRLL